MSTFQNQPSIASALRKATLRISLVMMHRAEECHGQAHLEVDRGQYPSPFTAKVVGGGARKSNIERYMIKDAKERG